MSARDELRGELDNLRVAAEWVLAHWARTRRAEVLAGLNEFFFAHSWFDGAETFERLAAVAGFDAGDPATCEPVALAAATYSLASGARSATTRSSTSSPLDCLPVLRARNMTRELAVVPAAPWASMACYRDVYPEARGATSKKLSRRSRARSATGSTESPAL